MSRTREDDAQDSCGNAVASKAYTVPHGRLAKNRATMPTGVAAVNTDGTFGALAGLASTVVQE
jgi:hypothetical protein